MTPLETASIDNLLWTPDGTFDLQPTDDVWRGSMIVVGIDVPDALPGDSWLAVCPCRTDAAQIFSDPIVSMTLADAMAFAVARRADGLALINDRHEVLRHWPTRL